VKSSGLMCCLVFLTAQISLSALAEEQLWFGTITERGTTTQARFEAVLEEGQFRRIVLAPYGRTPSVFKDVQHGGGRLRFSWPRGSASYRCDLRRGSTPSFSGACTAPGSEDVSVVIREFTSEDAALQGNARTAGEQDIAIARRAAHLLNDGRSWNRRDDRVCDRGGYPYRWSLFCALHQASIEVASGYEHLRPVMKAVRQAITGRHPNRRFAHTLMDFNNEAAQFQPIAEVLDEAMAILTREMRENSEAP
jgi:hypothetical protein